MNERDEAAGLPKNVTRRDNLQQRSSTADTLNRDGAMLLARRLQEYWHGQGYPAARFWAEPVDERFAKIGTYEIYRVVCNLVNGVPPRYRDDRGTRT
jgi:hypothetical protein